jgi:hypothetical protein
MTTLMVPFEIRIFMLDVVPGMIGLSTYIICTSWGFSHSDN